jgi:hypothetical protein
MFKVLGGLAVSMVFGAMLLTLLEPGTLKSAAPPPLLSGQSAPPLDHSNEYDQIRIVCADATAQDLPAAHLAISSDGTRHRTEPAPTDEPGTLVIRIDVDGGSNLISLEQFVSLRQILHYVQSTQSLASATLISVHPGIPNPQSQLDDLRTTVAAIQPRP